MEEPNSGRPWFKKKRFLLPAGIFAFAAVIAAASGGSGSSNTPVSGSNFFKHLYQTSLLRSYV